MQLGTRKPWDTDEQLVNAAWECGEPTSAVRDIFCRQGSRGLTDEKGVVMRRGKW